MLLILTTHVAWQHIGKRVLFYYICNKPIVITIKENCILDKYYFGSLSITQLVHDIDEQNSFGDKRYHFTC